MYKIHLFGFFTYTMVSRGINSHSHTKLRVKTLERSILIEDRIILKKVKDMDHAKPAVNLGCSSCCGSVRLRPSTRIKFKFAGKFLHFLASLRQLLHRRIAVLGLGLELNPNLLHRWGMDGYHTMQPSWGIVGELRSYGSRHK